MFAFFNLGAQEIVILVGGLCLVGVILAVIFGMMGGKKDGDG